MDSQISVVSIKKWFHWIDLWRSYREISDKSYRIKPERDWEIIFSYTKNFVS